MADHIAVDIDADDLVTFCGLEREGRAEGMVIWDRDALANDVSPEFVTAHVCRDCLEQDRARLAG